MCWKYARLSQAPFVMAFVSPAVQVIIARGGKVRIGRGSVLEGRGFLEVGPDASVVIGKRCRVMPGFEITVSQGSRLCVGDRVYVGGHVNMRCTGTILIDQGVRLGQFVSLIAGEYEFGKRAIPIGQQGFRNGTIEIHSGAWLGAGVIVLPDVKIGTGAVIGAGSVVTRDIPEYAVAVGNPARVVRFRE